MLMQLYCTDLKTATCACPGPQVCNSFYITPSVLKPRGEAGHTWAEVGHRGVLHLQLAHAKGVHSFSKTFFQKFFVVL